MADTTALKNRIRAAIKANDNQEITGLVLQQTLLDMLDELNSGTEAEASTRSNTDTALRQSISQMATTKADLVNGKVPASQLPAYIDEVVEYASISEFPKEGGAAKIYLALDTNKQYRWSGSQYVEISASLALGTIAGTAFDGGAGTTLTQKVGAIEEQLESIGGDTESLATRMESAEDNISSQQQAVTGLSTTLSALAESLQTEAETREKNDSNLVLRMQGRDKDAQGNSSPHDNTIDPFYYKQFSGGWQAYLDAKTWLDSLHSTEQGVVPLGLLRLYINGTFIYVLQNILNYADDEYTQTILNGDVMPNGGVRPGVSIYTRSRQFIDGVPTWTEWQRIDAPQSLIQSIINSMVNDQTFAPLSGGKVPASYLPAYVDEVVEYASISEFPQEGGTAKIYVALDTNKQYRWSGSQYIEISASLALGETASTAFAGNRGKALEQGAAMKSSNNAFSGSNTFGGHTALVDTLITGDLQINEGGIAVLSQGQTTNEMTTISYNEVKAQSFKKWNGTNFEELATVNEIVGTVDDVPIPSSNNPVKSGGVYDTTPSMANTDAESDLDVSDENGNVLMRLFGGHIKTKKFDSRNFSLDGKTLSIMGDSISTFQGMIPTGYSAQYPSGDVNTYDKTWWGKLIANDGMILQVNNSWAGSVVSNTSTTGQVCMSDDSRLNNLGANPDFILFFGGTNDFGYTANAAQLGKFDFDKEQDGGLDRTKFRQAVQYCIQQIQKLYPKSQLMIMLPLQRARYNEYGAIIQDYPAKNSLGIYEFEYRDVLKEAADIFGVPVIDTNKCGITFYNGTNNPSSSGGQSIYTIDGVHPNAAGMNLIYKSVKNKLLNYI